MKVLKVWFSIEFIFTLVYVCVYHYTSEYMISSSFIFTLQYLNIPVPLLSSDRGPAQEEGRGRGYVPELNAGLQLPAAEAEGVRGVLGLPRHSRQ